VRSISNNSSLDGLRITKKEKTMGKNQDFEMDLFMEHDSEKANRAKQRKSGKEKDKIKRMRRESHWR